MMKKWLLACLVLAIGFIGIGGYYMYDSIFPKAAPVKMPSSDDILSISITRADGHIREMDDAELETLLEVIGGSEPTRRLSVNDFPAADEYRTIEISTSVRLYRFFVYTDSTQVYVELPYEGIYRADNKILEIIDAGNG